MLDSLRIRRLRIYGNASLLDFYPSHEFFISSRKVFSYLPLCALIGKMIFSMHSCIPKGLGGFDEIRSITRAIYGMPDTGIVTDLLWADPRGKTGGKNFL